MSKIYDLVANAKVNIFLKVCGTYPNGYHRLFMLMQEIGLGDEITLELGDVSSSPAISIVSEADCPPEKDLCYKAAKLFYDNYSGDLQDIKITEVKHTPSQAGLGGGSSDAAAVLKTLQSHYGNPFDEETLLNMAARLGADVPFFLYGGSCFCEGIGEIVTPVPSLAGLPMILIKPSVGVSTPACFKAVDSEPITFDEPSYKEFMEKVFNSSDDALNRVIHAKAMLTNDLQKPAVNGVPLIAECVSALDDSGAVFAMMSGSGSCSFGIYASDEERDKAYDKISGDTRFTECSIYKVETK